MMKRIFTVMLVGLMGVLILVGCEREGPVTDRGAHLQLQEPSDVTITRGETAEVTLRVRRENLDDPIRISFDDLPDGVSVVDGPRELTGDEGTYILEADEDADLVEGHMASVTARGPEDLSHTQHFQIDVEEQE